MARVQMTFDDAHVVSFIPLSSEPHLIGSTVLYHKGSLDWALSHGGKQSPFDRLKKDTAGILPDAEVLGLGAALSKSSGHFEYLAVATQAILSDVVKQRDSSPDGVDLALPTVAALFHPSRRTNPIGGMETPAQAALGMRSTKLEVFEPSNESARQSLEVACVGGGAAVARAEWSHVLIKESLETPDAQAAGVSRSLINTLEAESAVVIIVEFHLSGIVLTPLRRITGSQHLLFNCHSVFLSFDFEGWLAQVMSNIDKLSYFNALDDLEKRSFLETFLYDLPIALDGKKGPENGLADGLDATTMAASLDANNIGIIEDLLQKLQISMWGRSWSGILAEDRKRDYGQLIALFRAFPTSQVEQPSNANPVQIVGYIPTGTLASHKLLGPIIVAAVQRLLQDPTVLPLPEEFDACHGVGRAARLFRDQKVSVGNRFWASVRLGEKAVEPRRPQRQLLTSADSESAFDLTVTPASSAAAIPLMIAFNLPGYHEKGAIEVEVRMGPLERIVAQLFLNGERYYGGEIAVRGDKGKAGDIQIHVLGHGEFEIFANTNHEQVYRTAERIGPRAVQAWRFLQD